MAASAYGDRVGGRVEDVARVRDSRRRRRHNRRSDDRSFRFGAWRRLRAAARAFAVAVFRSARRLLLDRLRRDGGRCGGDVRSCARRLIVGVRR